MLQKHYYFHYSADKKYCPFTAESIKLSRKIKTTKKKALNVHHYIIFYMVMIKAKAFRNMEKFNPRHCT